MMTVKTSHEIRFKALALLACLAMWASMAPSASAQDLTAPTQVINEYLDSLVNGDTEKLGQLIDGRMKQNNRQLVLSPGSYSQLLKTNYAGVKTTIENIAADGTRVRAKVRFDYPSGDVSLIAFILNENNGVWKITDEVY